MLRVEGKKPLQPEDGVGHAESDGGEDNERDAVALPRLLGIGIDADSPVDRAFGETEPGDPALEDGRHVRAQKAPGDGQDDYQGQDGPAEVHQNHSALNSATPR